MVFTCSLCPFYVIAFCCESAYGAIIWQVVYANRFAGLLWFVYTCLQSESNAIIIYGAQKSNFDENPQRTTKENKNRTIYSELWNSLSTTICL